MRKNIAVVEDNPDESELLKQYLKKFEKENNEEFSIVFYDNANLFLEEFNANFDIVFMDIMLPGINGMQAAEKMREIDKFVSLIFVTSMAQYAVKGYEVGALDFLVKPVSYYNFSLKLQRAIDYIADKKDTKIIVNTEHGIVCVESTHIKYIEVRKHELILHTTKGDIKTYGTLKKIEQQLPSTCFARCNICYLVNLRYVTSIKGFIAEIGSDEISISHPKKKEFVQALNKYLGGSI